MMFLLWIFSSPWLFVLNSQVIQDILFSSYIAYKTLMWWVMSLLKPKIIFRLDSSSWLIVLLCILIKPSLKISKSHFLHFISSSLSPQFILVSRIPLLSFSKSTITSFLLSSFVIFFAFTLFFVLMGSHISIRSLEWDYTSFTALTIIFCWVSYTNSAIFESLQG